MAKRWIRTCMVVAALGWLPSIALADEIVHFTNGAEMAVRSHAVDNGMVRLDLGGNSFIAFPMSMVDKIVSAGKDVFLNPTFHPANQAVAGSGASGSPGTPSVVADTTIRGGGASVGFNRQPTANGGAGVMLGEAADAIPVAPRGDLVGENAVAGRRRIFNPAFPAAPGGAPQVIMPPSAPKPPSRMSIVSRTPEHPPPPPVDDGTAGNPPQGDPAPEDPPDTP